MRKNVGDRGRSARPEVVAVGASCAAESEHVGMMSVKTFVSKESGPIQKHTPCPPHGGVYAWPF